MTDPPELLDHVLKLALATEGSGSLAPGAGRLSARSIVPVLDALLETFTVIGDAVNGVVETDDVAHLQAFLKPGAAVTTCEITPVSDKPVPHPG